jgi:hypothetical protein
MLECLRTYLVVIPDNLKMPKARISSVAFQNIKLPPKYCPQVLDIPN